jgi:hypothetical protein
MLFNNVTPSYLQIPQKPSVDESKRFEIFTAAKIKIILGGRMFYDAVGKWDYTAFIYRKKLKVTSSLFTSLTL